MKYYNKIKTEIQKNKDYKEIKEYYKNINDLNTYYNIGKILTKELQITDKKQNILLEEYAKKLTEELGKGYTHRNLYNMCEYYKLIKEEPKIKEITKLTWSHYLELMPLKDIKKITYYIEMTIKQNLSYRKLKEKIKNKDYENNKIITKELTTQKNQMTKEKLKNLILEELDNFLSLLGDNIAYIKNNYKTNNNNNIDLLLYSIPNNTYIIALLSPQELQKEDIIKLNTCMNYINKKEKTVVGIIISKHDSNYKITYSSNPNIIKTKKIA